MHEQPERDEERPDELRDAGLLEDRDERGAGGAAEHDPDGAARLLAKAAEAVIAEGAAAVVLGGAGLAGLAPAVAAHLPVPVLDSLDCLMEASLGEPLPFLPPPSSAPSLDLSPALARRLGG